MSDGIVWGFTGTQRGMTAAQRATVRRLLASLPVTEAHHGDCIGADAQFDEECEALGIRTIIHPPTIMTKRAWCARSWSMKARFAPLLGGEAPKRREVIELPPLSYLVRNRAIVDALPRETGALIGTPAEFDEQLRSGTWSTLRYADTRRATLRLVFPDGRVERFLP